MTIRNLDLTLSPRSITLVGASQRENSMNGTTVEREIKLRFESASDARAAILATGATPLLGRRLQTLLATGDLR